MNKITKNDCFFSEIVVKFEVIDFSAQLKKIPPSLNDAILWLN